ncbi:hypothetical protein BH10PSE19_BH10PSE19_08590 [soil metagenome]
MFEYTTSYFPIRYRLERHSDILLEEGLPLSPDPTSLLENADYLAELQRLGARGWQLINVQPLLRACYDYKPTEYSFAFPLTAGYFLFWQRKLVASTTSVE